MVAAAERPAPADPVVIGPTWQRDESGHFVLPERTLGWEIILWCQRNLLQPDGAGAGNPWRFTDEQARFVLWWYALTADDRWAYRYGMLRRLKGWGKDPLGAVLCAIEFVGPCRPDPQYLGAAEPRGVPVYSSWVQTAATSREQTRNTMTLFPGLLSPQLKAECAIEVNKEIVYAHHGRCQIQAVTSSPAALEGARSTFVLKNETHHWLSSNEGHEMAAVIARNAAKTGGRALAISNAHNPGEDSDAERDFEAWQKMASGRTRGTGMLYDSIEAPATTKLADEDSLRSGIEAARGDSWWVDPARLIDEIYDPRTPASTSRRYYLNQLAAAEDAWIAPQEWDVCGDPTRVLLPDEEITLGLDGSKSDDWTALVARRISDGHLFPIAMWDPEQHNGEIPLPDVDAQVRQCFERYDVVGFYSDYSPFEPYVDLWEQQLADGLLVHSGAGHTIAWDMRGRTREVTFTIEAFHQAILERQVTHQAVPECSQHVYNARRRPNQYGTTFAKEHRESARKVDWLAAAVLAWKAGQDYMALPDRKRRRHRTGRAVFM